MRTLTRLPYMIVLLLAFISASAYAQTTDLVGIVISGTPQDVQAAIDKGADANVRQADTGMTPLIAAAKFQQEEMIGVLVKSGADVNAHDAQGCTALMWASMYAKTPDVVKTLLAAGAGVDAVSGASTPLIWASFSQPKP